MIEEVIALCSLRFDADASDIAAFAALFDKAKERWGVFAATAKKALNRLAAQVDRIVDLSLTKQIDAALPKMNVSLARGFIPFGEIQGEIDVFTRQAALLIKDIGDKAVRDVEIAVQNAVSKGTSTKALRDLLIEQQGYTKNRAALIARDQIGKLNGNINKVRQTAVGIKRYTWRTMKDSRVRKSHIELDGKEFSWGKPPPEGHPGQPIRCRCVPQPLIDDSDFGL